MQMDSTTSSVDREDLSKEDEAEFLTPDSNRDKRKHSTASNSQPAKVKIWLWMLCFQIFLTVTETRGRVSNSFMHLIWLWMLCFAMLNFEEF